ncbi:RE2 [Symbiodinium sp. CCMP2456]|nr:RE2 [Symbiodinium sp. CCMP2456]
MVTSGATSFYAHSSWDGDPQLGDDSPPGHDDGGGDVARDDDSAGHLGNDRGGTWHQWAPEQPWSQWSEGWQSRRWGHSWDGAERGWNETGWSYDSARGYGNDGRWQKPAWGTASTGSGSTDGGAQERHSKESSSAGQWGCYVSAGRDGSLPDGWGPSSEAQGKGYHGVRAEGGRGPSEKMLVPTFSGNTGDRSEDLGTTARSYLRQVSAWRRMTRLSEDQQGLTLYQHLTDKAWVDAERLDMDKLASRAGVDYLTDWIRDRYLDVQVTQIGRSLSGFFRGLHRKGNQTVRDYMADFDRALSRLTEVGCYLPDVAAAWVFVDRMGLEEQAELNLLASVGNQYSLKPLQQAAIVHDRGLRKPWEGQARPPRKDWNGRKPFSANVADYEDYDIFDVNEAQEDDLEDDELVPEEVAQDLYQAFMTHASAKQKYRESTKLRGSDPESLKQLASEKLKAAKAKSFCAGCKRRGHWHKDAICPLNRGNGAPNPSPSVSATNGSSTAPSTKDPVRANFPCHVVHVTWEIDANKHQDFLAITDTACSRSVVGASWIDSYLAEAKRQGVESQFVSCKEAFRFGASKVFVATYGVVLGFELGGYKIALKVAVVNGEVPLLVSRGALGKLGMIIDVENNTASFRKLGVRDMVLSITESGHPAFVVHPAALPDTGGISTTWDAQEIQIFSREGAYIGVCKGQGSEGLHGGEDEVDPVYMSVSRCSSVWMVNANDDHGLPVDASHGRSENHSPSSQTSYDYVFYPKKIGSATKNLLLDETFNPETFMATPTDLLTAPVITRPKNLSEFTKAELITEATARNLWFHPSWTSTEIRSLIQEDRRRPSGNHPADAGMSRMTVDQLKEKAMELGYHLPPYATKGTIMRILRDQKGMGSSSILTFGRFKGKMFSETPENYRTWALREVSSNENPSEDLVMFANWWQGELHRWRDSPHRAGSTATSIDYLDPEENATIPYVEDANSTTSWDMVTREALASPYPGAKAKSRPVSSSQPPVTPYRRRTLETESPTAIRMDLEVPREVGDVLGGEIGGAQGQAWDPARDPVKAGQGPDIQEYDEDYDEIYFDCDEDKVKYLQDHAEHNGEAGSNYLVRQHGDGDESEGSELPEEDDADDLFGDLFGIDIGEVMAAANIGGNDYMSSRGCGDTAQRKPPGKENAMWETQCAKARRCEELSKTKLRNKEFEYADLLEIVQNIPLTKIKDGKNLRRGGGQRFEYFLGGMYTYGPFKGISRGSRTLSWTTKFVNAFLRSKHEGAWTSFVIFRNSATEVHADSHNLVGAKVSTVTFGDFSGGQLWIEDPNGGPDLPDYVARADKTGKVRYGTLVDTREQVYSFDGKDSRTATPDFEMNFVSFAFLCEALPWEKDELATLGIRSGVDKTFEAASMEYYVAEPFAYEPTEEPDLDTTMVQKTIEAFDPAIIWVHGNRTRDFLEDIVDTLYNHIDKGRQVAFEAPSNDPCWNNRVVKELFERYEARCVRRAAEPDVVRINDVYHEEVKKVDKKKDPRKGQRLSHSRRASDFDAKYASAIGEVVALDAFYVYDVNKEKVELMMAIDIGTGFVSEFYKDIPQRPWRTRTWKEIWVRLVDEKTATYKEAGMVITAVNSAMNTLRRESGFSPSQAVWGRDPKLPEDVLHSPQDEHVEHIMSHDRQRAREHSLRTSAKETYSKCQNDSRLRRSLLQRSRVAGPELEVGTHVYFYRKPKNNNNWQWNGPAVIIGREGPNYWTSFTGRCHLVAPEHLRLASAEELGAAFALRSTQDDLERLLQQDFAEEDVFGNEDMRAEADPELPPGDQETGARDTGSRRRENPSGSAQVTKRHRVKGPPSDAEMPAEQEVFMMKLPKTPRGREKALEKEIPWRLIPESQHESFRQAEQKQWKEHVDHQALQPLSVEESRKINQERPDRILGSRFAYKDKFWCQRKADPTVGWKPKARLVIHGHRDPDLLKGLSTHAPTISRQGIHLLLQVLASNLKKGWRGFAGDVTAAFLCGEQLERELYLRQPATGLGDLHPEQLLRIRKPIFGLVDSPSAWWTKFHKTLREIDIRDGDKKWRIVQNSLDHCIFMAQEVLGLDKDGKEILGPPEAYLGVHVDDVLLVGEGRLCEIMKERLSAEFPIQDWEMDRFEYVGSYIEIFEDKVKISQGSYAATRLFQVDVDRTTPDHFPATEIQKHDNMSLIGALSWMASQTRPDLQVGVSMSQQRQKDPCAGDVRFTNQLARRAMEHQDEGLTFYPVNFEDAVLLCYHDAGWANAPQSQDDPYYQLTPEEDERGLIKDGPYARKDAKAKKTSSTIASQLGGLYVLADATVLRGQPTCGSIVDWKSGACERVCRSTFTAETMACCTAADTGIFIVKFLETLLNGRLARTKTRFQLRFISDCRSLYDHLTRDGVPRVPTCKRLAIDLAGIREDLKDNGKIVWVPTWAQLADILTKPLKADEWWKTLKEGLKLTFKEGG